MNTCKPPLLAFMLLVIAVPATAGQAYTWTDREGVTHFSESVPPDRAQDAGRIELQSAPVIPGPTPERFRAISEQSARMAAERRKREQVREKRRQLAEKERQARLAELEAEQEYQEEYYTPYRYWYPPAYGYPRRPHHKHPRHPHHPPHRREFRAGKTLTQKRNAEALRDAYRHW
jgi:hypothetical protein